MANFRNHNGISGFVAIGVPSLLLCFSLGACGSATPKASTNTSKGSSTNGRSGSGTPITRAASSSGSTSAPSPSVSTGVSTSATPAPASASNPLVVDPVAKRVTFFVTASQGGGFNFDGKANGQLTLTTPVGWSVNFDCHNGGSIFHSCAIVSDASSQAPVFPGAEVANPLAGLNPGQTGSFTFTASTVGSYRVVCLVPGHEASGMWATFDVSATAPAPTIQP